MSDLAGKVALVTGGSRGIGAAIARRLADDGADIAFTYLNAADDAENVAKSIAATGRQVLAVRADSADPDAVVGAIDRTARELGRLDILVNNAGIYPAGALGQIAVDDIDWALAVHVRAALVASQAAAEHMGPDGRIVSIGSSLVERVPGPGLLLYTTSKAALVGLTKALARELGPRGITANVVQPGPIDTDMNPADGEYADSERALLALGEFGQPDDIAATVAHLAGPGGRYVTGASIAVDGGWAA